MKSRFRGLASFRKPTHLAVLAIAVPLVALCIVPSAMATPKGEFAKFADCPLSNEALSGCIVASTESGEFKVGTTAVPIKNMITLQGGFIEDRETGAQEFVGAADGNTLSKTPQSVPGGLAGLVKCFEISNFFERLACEVIFENGLTGVTATTELAAPASSIGLSELNLLTANGIALSLPVKVKLDNPLLGGSCYIGSNAHPVVIDLTTGTTKPPKPNEPIKGNVGTFENAGGGAILIISKNSLVNNSFAAPAAEGCGGIFSFLIDPLVNAKLKLPAAAGNNTAILNGTLKQAGAEAVRESE
jgi:hypothetical protein